MKKVVLLGDSIRLGYQATVKKLLEGEAEVWSPDDNCMHSVNHLFNAYEWYVSHKADVIHFNFGLWDCRRIIHGHEDNLIPPEIFCRNIEKILGVIRKETCSIPIWATITPVIESRHRALFQAESEPYRVGSDVERYNAAASSVLSTYQVAVNDLHEFVERNGTEKLICEDGVHYTDAGYQLLGEQVANCIRRVFSTIKK